MGPFVLALLQVAQAPPDIALHATVHAQSVRIAQRGNATLQIHASPDDGSLVEVHAPKANGAANLRNVTVTVDAQARIASGPENKRNSPDATDAHPPR